MTVFAIVQTLNAGYDHDREQVEQAGFVLGDRFEVRDISMGQSSTTVSLVGFQRGFNSVFFNFEENDKPLNIYGDPRFNPYLQRYTG